jgi:hypothetical protein
VLTAKHLNAMLKFKFGNKSMLLHLGLKIYEYNRLLKCAERLHITSIVMFFKVSKRLFYSNSVEMQRKWNMLYKYSDKGFWKVIWHLEIGCSHISPNPLGQGYICVRPYTLGKIFATNLGQKRNYFKQPFINVHITCQQSL